MGPDTSDSVILRLQQISKDIPTFDLENLREVKEYLQPDLEQVVHQIGARSLFKSDEEFEAHLNKLYDVLHTLSERISSQFPEESKYAAEIQGIARGVLPPPKEMPHLPPENWAEIFSHTDLKNVLRIDQEKGDIAAYEKKKRVEENRTSLKEAYNCKTAEEAAACIKNRDLSVVNLGDFDDLTVEILRDVCKDCPGLKVLILPKHLESLPAEIGNLTLLEELDMTQTSVTSFPPEIGNLENLKVLQLINSKLKTLPEEIGKLKKLESLFLSGDLNRLPAEFGTLDLKLLSVLGELALNPEIYQLKKIETLIMFGIPEVPSEIQNLTSLKELDIGGSIETLPHEISALTSLEVLRISGKMTAIPPIIDQLHHLKTLAFSSLLLTDLPSEIGELKSLEELDLLFTSVNSLPAEIYKLKNLQKVRLNHDHFFPFQTKIKAAQTLAEKIPALIARAQYLTEDEQHELTRVSKREDLKDIPHAELVQEAKLVIKIIEKGSDGIPEKVQEMNALIKQLEVEF